NGHRLGTPANLVAIEQTNPVVLFPVSKQMSRQVSQRMAPALRVQPTHQPYLSAQMQQSPLDALLCAQGRQCAVNASLVATHLKIYVIRCPFLMQQQGTVGVYFRLDVYFRLSACFRLNFYFRVNVCARIVAGAPLNAASLRTWPGPHPAGSVAAQYIETLGLMVLGWAGL